MAQVSPLSRKHLNNLTDSLSKAVKQFNRYEVECLIKLFHVLMREQSERRGVHGIDRNKFRNILHNTFGMTDDMIMDRDCFDVYDLNGDGYVSREEMFHMLKHCLVKQPAEEDPDEGIKDLVEITLKKMDYDHDGRLSYADYEKSVEDESLLLEAFGQCLPDAKSIVAFETQAFQKADDV
ncbi:calaxin isoform X2 [Latimeria chalumnae]|uniref:calaxin isoform X2 n=1 Tax=Latimeria chalumnae TaxID=7897 RepID=UPI0003C17AEC|nr:PREDICTED: EF-hand calcium-binding domain-containing protein 1 isoform X2 [Latimeria chalumnae]|eukprot:XP_006002686.1 PREDICTED: EF-hand calcium-binding domain-containing protein 1 isoform X2 [Latimeria chalumnae]